MRGSFRYDESVLQGGRPSVTPDDAIGDVVRIVAEAQAKAATGMDPLLIALLVGGAGAAGFGIYELTKNKNNCTVSCN